MSSVFPFSFPFPSPRRKKKVCNFFSQPFVSGWDRPKRRNLKWGSLLSLSLACLSSLIRRPGRLWPIKYFFFSHFCKTFWGILKLDAPRHAEKKMIFFSSMTKVNRISFPVSASCRNGSEPVFENGDREKKSYCISCILTTRFIVSP